MGQETLTMNPVRWGVIGVGRFGTVHARVLSTLPGSQLVALCTRNADRLAEAASEFAVSRTYTDYSQLLEGPEIDAVSITTHWQEHHEIALAALASGKHVLLEKPMAATGAQCLELVRAAEKARGFFMVGHVCRFDTRVSLAKEAIDAGRIGRVVSMHARRNLPKAPGKLRLDRISPLMGDGVHDADLMMWFAGRGPTSVYGRNVRVDRFAYPDVGWAMLHFGEEAIGVIETVWRLPENTPTVIDARMEVIGTEGKLSIDCSHTGLTILDAKGMKMPDTMYWPIQHGRQVGALALELDYFAGCVRTDTPPGVVTPLEAARAVAVMEAAELSSERREVVDFAFE
jgi:UDP-N-acetylglucosamine 3-dehydrogenase